MSGTLAGSLRNRTLRALLPRRWYNAVTAPYNDDARRDKIMRNRPRVCMNCGKFVPPRQKFAADHLAYIPLPIRWIFGWSHWRIIHPLQIIEVCENPCHKSVPTGRNRKGRTIGWTFLAHRTAYGSVTMTRHLWRWWAGRAMVVAYYGLGLALTAAATWATGIWWTPLIPAVIVGWPWLAWWKDARRHRKPKPVYVDYRDRLPTPVEPPGDTADAFGGYYRR